MGLRGFYWVLPGEVIARNNICSEKRQHSSCLKNIYILFKIRTCFSISTRMNMIIINILDNILHIKFLLESFSVLKLSPHWRLLIKMDWISSVWYNKLRPGLLKTKWLCTKSDAFQSISATWCFKYLMNPIIDIRLNGRNGGGIIKHGYLDG